MSTSSFSAGKSAANTTTPSTPAATPFVQNTGARLTEQFFAGEIGLNSYVIAELHQQFGPVETKRIITEYQARGNARAIAKPQRTAKQKKNVPPTPLSKKIAQLETSVQKTKLELAFLEGLEQLRKTNQLSLRATELENAYVEQHRATAEQIMPPPENGQFIYLATLYPNYQLAQDIALRRRNLADFEREIRRRTANGYSDQAEVAEYDKNLSSTWQRLRELQSEHEQIQNKMRQLQNYRERLTDKDAKSESLAMEKNLSWDLQVVERRIGMEELNLVGLSVHPETETQASLYRKGYRPSVAEPMPGEWQQFKNLAFVSGQSAKAGLASSAGGLTRAVAFVLKNTQGRIQDTGYDLANWLGVSDEQLPPKLYQLVYNAGDNLDRTANWARWRAYVDGNAGAEAFLVEVYVHFLVMLIPTMGAAKLGNFLAEILHLKKTIGQAGALGILGAATASDKDAATMLRRGALWASVPLVSRAAGALPEAAQIPAVFLGSSLGPFLLQPAFGEKLKQALALYQAGQRHEAFQIIVSPEVAKQMALWGIAGVAAHASGAPAAGKGGKSEPEPAPVVRVVRPRSPLPRLTRQPAYFRQPNPGDVDYGAYGLVPPKPPVQVPEVAPQAPVPKSTSSAAPLPGVAPTVPPEVNRRTGSIQPHHDHDFLRRAWQAESPVPIQTMPPVLQENEYAVPHRDINGRVIGYYIYNSEIGTSDYHQITPSTPSASTPDIRATPAASTEGTTISSHTANPSRTHTNRNAEECEKFWQQFLILWRQNFPDQAAVLHELGHLEWRSGLAAEKNRPIEAAIILRALLNGHRAAGMDGFREAMRTTGRTPDVMDGDLTDGYAVARMLMELRPTTWSLPTVRSLSKQNSGTADIRAKFQTLFDLAETAFSLRPEEVVRLILHAPVDAPTSQASIRLSILKSALIMWIDRRLDDTKISPADAELLVVYSRNQLFGNPDIARYMIELRADGEPKAGYSPAETVSRHRAVELLREFSLHVGSHYCQTALRRKAFYEQIKAELINPLLDRNIKTMLFRLADWLKVYPNGGVQPLMGQAQHWVTIGASEAELKRYLRDLRRTLDQVMNGVALDSPFDRYAEYQEKKANKHEEKKAQVVKPAEELKPAPTTVKSPFGIVYAIPDGISHAEAEKLRDQEIILLLQRNLRLNEHLFEVLVHRHTEVVKRTIGYTLSNSAIRSAIDEEGIAQETWWKVYSSLSQFDPYKPFLPWVITIARNNTTDAVRHALPRRTEPVEITLRSGHTGIDPSILNLKVTAHGESDLLHKEKLAERSRLVEKLLQLVNQLPEEQRIVFVLQRLQGYSHSEIAEKLNIRFGTVKTRSRYATLAMKMKIDEISQDQDASAIKQLLEDLVDTVQIGNKSSTNKTKVKTKRKKRKE